MAKTVRKRIYRGNLLSIILVSAVVGSLALVVKLRINVLEQKDAAYAAREDALIDQLEDQEQRSEELKEYEEYVQSKEYYEEIAKEKLGLVNPDEILLKPRE